jgi:hypothetical protein
MDFGGLHSWSNPVASLSITEAYLKHTYVDCIFLMYTAIYSLVMFAGVI